MFSYADRHLLPSLAVTFVVAAAVFAAVTAIGIGGGSSPAPASATAPYAEYSERSPHVLSQLTVTGNRNGAKVQVLADPDAPNPNIHLAPGEEFPPLVAAQFDAPIAAYKKYSEGQLSVLEGEVQKLGTALASGDRAASEAAWRTAWARYLRLGAVYLERPLETLNEAIDGSAGNLPGGPSNPDFSGLHRIEYGLWTGAAPVSLVRWSTALAADVRRMRSTLPGVTIDPLDYATRAHEILEDAVRDLLSGNDVPWSGEGVLGTQAGLSATREVIDTLRPLLDSTSIIQGYRAPKQRSPVVVDADLGQLQSELTSLAAAHGGRLPTNAQMTKAQTEALDAAIGQALEGLAQVPGMLETTVAQAPAQMPQSAIRIDR